MPGRYYLGAFLLVLLWLPLPLGSATTSGWLAVSLIVVALTALYIRQFSSSALPVIRQNRLIFACWFVLIIWHILLLIPLPESLIEAIRPQRNFLAFSEHNDWLALTYSTTDTLISLLRVVTYTGLFTLALLLFRSARRLKILLRCLLAVGLFQTLYAALPVFFAMQSSLILDLPVKDGASGTLLRGVSYGHLLLIALCAVLGLLIIRIKPSATGNLRQRIRRIVNYFFGRKAVLRIATLLLYGGLVMAAQAEVIWATVIATVFAVVTGFILFSPRPKLFSTFMLSLLCANVLMILAASYLADRALVLDEPPYVTLEDRQWSPATPGVADHLILGAGPGTAKDIEADELPLPVSGVIPVGETDVTQFLAEYGVPASLIFVALFMVSLGNAVIAMARRRHLVFRATALSCAGALAGTAYLAIVSTSLQTPTVMAYVAVLMAVSLVCLQCRKYQKA
ncbi:hypothetical protein [Salinimonas iocasae]|uniref:O-antigen ligase domain-containing protein n=1 Tax=Salinimonas iocasae TaxID=2572577 RepID=A0A5B7YFB7_9ALTE|nr:hypothetical protein [Salinimonas iocasae]QCZ94452.1 hypothetical protein FBQ74_13680 [Salinimonas iocasae]